MVHIDEFSVILRGKFLLPNNVRDKITSAKYLVTQNFKVVRFVIVYGYPNRSIVRKNLM